MKIIVDFAIVWKNSRGRFDKLRNDGGKKRLMVVRERARTHCVKKQVRFRPRKDTER